MPTALPAASIVTAKPMPTKVRASVGLKMAVTMPITSPSIVTSGPPELPGLAAASNWISLVEHALPVGRAELAIRGRRPRRPTPTGRCRTEIPRRPLRRPACSRCVVPSVAAGRSSGIVLRLHDGEIVFGLACPPLEPRTRGRRKRSPSPASRPATTCRLVRMMPWSTITTPEPTSRSPSPRRRRRRRSRARAPPTGSTASAALAARDGRRLVLERVQHGGVDVVLRELLRPRPRRVVDQHEGEREERRPRRRARTEAWRRRNRAAAGPPRGGGGSRDAGAAGAAAAPAGRAPVPAGRAAPRDLLVLL